MSHVTQLFDSPSLSACESHNVNPTYIAMSQDTPFPGYGEETVIVFDAMTETETPSPLCPFLAVMSPVALIHEVSKKDETLVPANVFTFAAIHDSNFVAVHALHIPHIMTDFWECWYTYSTFLIPLCVSSYLEVTLSHKSSGSCEHPTNSDQCCTLTLLTSWI